ncbi:hypothetical protein H696_05649 [Fonticula alba]|uniref:Derlin n=1 Tax=Fonticula alba TaxID=691883 RepID=A0A058Z333_FONAL|nr:hypothetical protein H696_05649 [Fonticula alba]KCV67922.1 hypothetical protein H696_05649 [Fonticula alba]|eukprot:XP_009497742.1 hypothetical protein H696_05649 [Fonticula alba]
MAAIDQWYRSMPLVTRTYATLAVGTTLACHIGLLRPLQLYLNLGLVFKAHEYWRLVTNQLFFGMLGMEFVFRIYFLIHYSWLLETGHFRGRRADFVWMLILEAAALTILAPFTRLLFLGTALSFSLVYVWARRSPDVRVAVLGLVPIRAPWLPWALLIVPLILRESLPIADLLGIAVGHLYYYLDAVLPTIIHRDFVGAPRWLKRLLDDPNDPASIAAAGANRA